MSEEMKEVSRLKEKTRIRKWRTDMSEEKKEANRLKGKMGERKRTAEMGEEEKIAKNAKRRQLYVEKKRKICK